MMVMMTHLKKWCVVVCWCVLVQSPDSANVFKQLWADMKQLAQDIEATNIRSQNLMARFVAHRNARSSRRSRAKRTRFGLVSSSSTDGGVTPQRDLVAGNVSFHAAMTTESDTDG